MKKRPKQVKLPDPEYVRKMQELRRSSATTPVPSGKAYKRKDKHGRIE